MTYKNQINIRPIPIIQSKRNKFGDWAFIRYLKNQEIPFELAYFIMFQKSPQR